MGKNARKVVFLLRFCKTCLQVKLRPWWAVWVKFAYTGSVPVARFSCVLLIALLFSAVKYSMICLLCTRHSRLHQTSGRVKKRTFRVCKNRELWVANVPSVCITMFENQTDLLGNHFKIEQGTEFLTAFLNRTCHFEIVVFSNDSILKFVFSPFKASIDVCVLVAR